MFGFYLGGEQEKLWTARVSLSEDIMQCYTEVNIHSEFQM